MRVPSAEATKSTFFPTPSAPPASSPIPLKKVIAASTKPNRRQPFTDTDPLADISLGRRPSSMHQNRPDRESVQGGMLDSNHRGVIECRKTTAQDNL